MSAPGDPGAPSGPAAEAGPWAGWTSLEGFMERALYDPRTGYYAARVRGVGRRGDFATAASLHPALGQAVARWARRHRAEVGAAGVGGGGRWHLVEIGPGEGHLAEALLRALGWWGRRGLCYHLVEVSPGLRERQAARLTAAGFGRLARWHPDPAAALAGDAAGGRALLFSNELVDAFPCRQFERAAPAGTWREVGVRPGPDGTWTEALAPAPLDPAAEPELVAALEARRPLRPAPAQRVELHLAYRRWLARWRPAWRAGRLLTVDYGDRPPALYERRPRGTLRAYFQHLRLEGDEVYRRPGRQDLTADVNFADLQAWGEALGLRTTGYETQADFLVRHLGAPGAADPVLGSLLDPAGAGAAFKVLEQQPGDELR